MNLLDILKRHTKYTFESIDILFSSFNEDLFDEEINGFHIWQQFYHMINSIDRIFTDPADYKFPGFHELNMNNLEYSSLKMPTKKTLLDYYEEVKDAALDYLARIPEQDLYLKSNHKTITMTKLDHILVQLRHIAWHIGYFHSCAKVLFGETPEHVLIKNDK